MTTTYHHSAAFNDRSNFLIYCDWVPVQQAALPTVLQKTLILKYCCSKRVVQPGLEVPSVATLSRFGDCTCEGGTLLK